MDMKRVAQPDVDGRGRGVTRRLARHTATLSYEALPQALVERTKQCLLDTLGVTIGASTLAPEANIAARYIEDLGGKPQSTVLGFGFKTSALGAAFLNGSLSHMLDYDDISNGGHVSIATVPVACALAEKLGGVGGRELITAIAAGADLHIRLDQSIDILQWEMAEGWFGTQLLGFLSGAAAAGRLLGLTEEQMENALGIAFNQLSGSRQMAVGASTHMRTMEAGFTAHAALLSAELAQRGTTGSKEIFEGRYGFFNTYVRTKTPNWDALGGDLGTRFPLLDPYAQRFKVWPACAYTHPVNMAIRELQQEFKIAPDEVEAITISGGTGATPLLFEPIERKRRPRTSVDGKYSIPFTAAVMMVKGNVTLRDYTAEGLSDPVVLAMCDRVGYSAESEVAAPEGQNAGQQGGKARPPRHPSSDSKPLVEIRMKDDRVLSRRPRGVPGDPDLPVSQGALEEKFRDCISYSAKPVPARSVDLAIEMIRNLEDVSDATEIMRLLGSTTR